MAGEAHPVIYPHQKGEDVNQKKLTLLSKKPYHDQVHEQYQSLMGLHSQQIKKYPLWQNKSVIVHSDFGVQSNASS
jgi:N-acetyl-anhydromuramyl-L-alanine amidase AmpD